MAVVLNRTEVFPEVKPPLKWAGGKRWLVPILRSYYEKHRDKRLVEPLAGGLAVSLGLMPRYALLNDINPHPINFYRWLKSGLMVTIEMKNDKAHYYEARKRFNDLIRMGREFSAEAAQLFYYLNRTGYNGLCRFNRKGEFNVPFGRYKRIHYAKTEDWRPYQEVFRNWDFTVGDFQTIPLEPDDFIYADPPYDVEFTQYSKESFSWEDQVRLAEWLAAHEGPVVISNQATERVERLYKKLGFKVLYEEAPRMISCNGDRTRALEVLALKGV